MLKRILHRGASCRSAVNDADMYVCPKIDRTQDMAETAQRRSPTPLIDEVGPGRSETHTFSNWPILITRSWHRRRHLNLEVLKVLVCRVTLSLATTYGVAFTSCFFP